MLGKVKKILYKTPTNEDISNLVRGYKKEKFNSELFSKRLVKMKGDLTTQELTFNLILSASFFLISSIYEFGPRVINKVVESTDRGHAVKAISTGALFVCTLIAIFYLLINIQKKISKLSFKIDVMEEFRNEIIFKK